MTALKAADLRAAMAVALDAQACQSVEALRRELLPGIRRLVPCDFIGYNEIDLQHGTALGVFDPEDGGFEGIEERFLQVVHQHPLVRRQQSGDLSARALSDFLTVRHLHGMELYQDFYKLIDAEDQLAFGLGGEFLVAFALCRPRRNFGKRDREILELLRPHLAQAYARVRAHARLQDFLRSLEHCVEDRGLGLIQLDAYGRVEHAAGAALELLEAYGCRDGTAVLGRHVVDGPRGRLRISEQRAAGARRTLILEEQRACPPSPEALRSLGLTDRQAQVLRLLACGKANRGIASELGVSTATVEKHLEHIYARLGVSSRTEAIARFHG